MPSTKLASLGFEIASGELPNNAAAAAAAAAAVKQTPPRGVRLDGRGMSKDDVADYKSPESREAAMSAPGAGAASAAGAAAASAGSSLGLSLPSKAAFAHAVAHPTSAAAQALLGGVVDGIRKTLSGTLAAAFRDRVESGSTDVEIVNFGAPQVDEEETVRRCRGYLADVVCRGPSRRLLRLCFSS